jgi:hypothetical protein
MDDHLNGEPDIDWDGFINFPQTPDLSAQSPFNIDEHQGGFYDSQGLSNIGTNAITDVDNSYR